MVEVLKEVSKDISKPQQAYSMLKRTKSCCRFSVQQGINNLPALRKPVKNRFAGTGYALLGSGHAEQGMK